MEIFKKGDIVTLSKKEWVKEDELLIDCSAAKPLEFLKTILKENWDGYIFTKGKDNTCSVFFSKLGDHINQDKSIIISLPSNWLQLKTRYNEGDTVVVNSLIESRETDISFAPWCHLSDADEISEIKEGVEGMVVDVSQVIQVDFYSASKGDNDYIYAYIPPFFLNKLDKANRKAK